MTACPKSEEPTMNAPRRAPVGSAVAADSAKGPTSPTDAALPGDRPEFTARAAERREMVKNTIAARGVLDPRVLSAMRRVPRHLFVPEALQGSAYADRPLPIGDGQTISQPFIVAFMSDAARIRPTDNCLEIGTGSGYQAAVLAELCKRTASIEYLPSVARRGAENLRRAGYLGRVQLRTGDGYVGWPEEAPFDVILVTAAPETTPAPLLEQLAVGGRLVIPLGRRDGAQELRRITRSAKGQGGLRSEKLLSVRFVPFLGDGGTAR